MVIVITVNLALNRPYYILQLSASFLFLYLTDFFSLGSFKDVLFGVECPSISLHHFISSSKT